MCNCLGKGEAYARGQVVSTSLASLLEQFPDEAAAERYLEQSRWPNGARCPRCGSDDVKRGTQAKRKRQLWYCGKCAGQFSVTSGTIMHSAKLPLNIWLIALHAACLNLIPGHLGAPNASAFANTFGITKASAWTIFKKIGPVVRSGQSDNSLAASLSNMFTTQKTLYKSKRGIDSIWKTEFGESAKDRIVELFGAKVTLGDVADVSGKSPQNIAASMRGGKSAEESAFGVEHNSTGTKLVTDEVIRAALVTHGTVARVARALGINHGTCWSRCERLGLLTHKGPRVAPVSSGKHSCSRCGERGHNSRTCPAPES